MNYKNVELYNVEDFIEYDTKGALKFIRISDELRLQLNERAQSAAFYGCGCEIRFNMISDIVKVTLQVDQGYSSAAQGIAEVFYGPYQGPYQICPSLIGTEPTELIIKKPENLQELKRIAQEKNLKYDPELVRIILPYDRANLLIDIQGEISLPRPEQSPDVKYLAYGSSITHGGSSISPTGSYAMRIAQKLGVDLINLGFAGSAHLEECMADYIADRKDWSFATIELGINVVGKWEHATFEKKVDYFISRIAEANQNKWIFCTDLFIFGMDYKKQAKANDFRNIVKNKILSMNLPKLVYINGTELLTSSTGLSADLTHPSESGCEEIASNFLKVINKRMFYCLKHSTSSCLRSMRGIIKGRM